MANYPLGKFSEKDSPTFAIILKFVAFFPPSLSLLFFHPVGWSPTKQNRDTNKAIMYNLTRDGLCSRLVAHFMQRASERAQKPRPHQQSLPPFQMSSQDVCMSSKKALRSSKSLQECVVCILTSSLTFSKVHPNLKTLLGGYLNFKAERSWTQTVGCQDRSPIWQEDPALYNLTL